jgi:hypothetical protein
MCDDGYSILVLLIFKLKNSLIASELVYVFRQSLLNSFSNIFNLLLFLFSFSLIGRVRRREKPPNCT